MTAFGTTGISAVTSAAALLARVNAWTADQTFNDNINLTFGTGGDVDLDYNGTNFVIDPAVVGSGVIVVGSGEGGTTAGTGTSIRTVDLATGGAGNIAGADLTFAAGLGIGTGDVGTVAFSLPIVASSGDNIQTTAVRLTLDMVASTTMLTMQAAQGLTIGTNAGNIILAPASTSHLEFQMAGGGNLGMAGGTKFFLDGVAGHTSISESSNDVVRIIVGGVVMLELVEAGTDVINVTAASLDFQNAAIISTTAGDLTLSPAGNVTISTGQLEVNDILHFDTEVADPAGGVAAIWKRSTGTGRMGFNVATGKEFGFFVNGGEEYSMTATRMALNNADLLISAGDLSLTAGFVELTEMAAPGAGGANTARIYAVVDGGSLTDLAAVFQDGTVDIFAQEV